MDTNTNCLNLADWDSLINHIYPEAHILQTGAWGELKSGFGWYPVRVSVPNAAAQILFRKLPLGFSIAYIPKGPLGLNWEALLIEIDRICKKNKAIFLKIEPDCWEPLSQEYSEKLSGFHRVNNPTQPRRTIVVPLDGDEETLINRMKQKTRYNIRLAQKKGVSIRIIDSSRTLALDIETFHGLMQKTGQRDGFGVHTKEYYKEALRLFSSSGNAALLFADYQGQSVASIMVFGRGSRSWYFYGASSDDSRQVMPTYLIQWEAIRWAKGRGYSEYDLWGVPDEDEETLENEFSNRSDGLWGVYRFKRGFGGILQRNLGAWEKVYSKPLYALYRLILRGRES